MEQYYYALVSSASPIATTHNVQNKEYRDLSYSIYTLYQQNQFDDQKRHERPIIPSFERDIQFYFISSQRTAIQYIHVKHKQNMLKCKFKLKLIRITFISSETNQAYNNRPNKYITITRDKHHC